ncbi:glucose-6-phosphate isomerase [Gangjinia marincola]|uniref:Glucose-6-phosphate isomerase n=1 Tax=Gangjinia marincola TaxID=578463 RepID=A0ABP3XST0_9FLAO
MPLKAINPTTTNAWKNLQQHFDQGGKDINAKELMQSDPARAKEMKIRWKDFYVDYSKNRVTHETLELLIQLANEVELSDAIEKYFSGDLINQTEGRAVLHTALRNNAEDIFHGEKNISADIRKTLAKIKVFSTAVNDGSWKGHTGKAITHVVNIGIGGSDLGPQMVVDALKYYKTDLDVRFISNVDGDHVMETLKDLDRETTLFTIVSKTFTTQETLSNAQTVRSWFLEDAPTDAVEKHFVAVSTNLEAVSNFGIAQENIFPMENWVGGRFSLWSAVGLSIACAVGFKHFNALLEGAHEMDQHFKDQPLEGNIPVVLGLLTIWYNNFFGAESEALIPYTQYLQKLAPYLQQGIMESNGKSVDRNGDKVKYQTGTIIWGEPGTNAQHAFFQLIHQGTKLIPTDFIGFKTSLYGNKDHHDKLMSNFFAQTEALLQGKEEAEVHSELKAQDKSPEEIERLLPFKLFEGNKPTTTILIDQLTPKSLGSLIAMYEHKLFVQGVIWNIYSYDQWGVELGKQLGKAVLKDLEAGKEVIHHDASTNTLINRYLD